MTLAKNIKRVNIFLGPLGSGKTAVALNSALHLAANGEESVLVDLDIINPYFRSRSVRKEFAGYGIEVICPPERIARGDLPALPGAVRGALVSNRRVIFDVGGDSAGATVLGCYQPYLPKGEYRLFFVVNTRRPFMRTVEEIAATAREIETAARTKIDFIVNNTNLGRQTSVAHVREGLKITRAAAARLNISVAFSSVLDDLSEPAKNQIDGQMLPLRMFLNPPWD
ncbi:MAG: hypothetical protein C4570_07440 [Ammonifex sp.]|nr:MAG: hypothetical protein C4570_07440 [Ammonifex sp.]